MEEELLKEVELEPAELPPKPKKKKKPPVSPEHKKFMLEAGLLFSSLSCRGCPYLYFNVAPGVLILSNSTTAKTEEHGDRLINYSVPELSLHIIRCKSDDVEKKVRSLLHIPDTGYYCVHAMNLIALLRKHQIGDVEIFTTPDGDTVLVPKGRKTYEAKNVVGWTVESFHVVRELHSYFQQMEIVGTPEHRSATPHVYRPMNVNPVITGRFYYEDLVMSDFRRSDGEMVFPNCTDKVNIVCLDGLTSVSLREFIPKIASKPYELFHYAWTVGDAYILSMTIFENEWVSIRSMRPNILTIPIPQIPVAPTSVLMSLKESDYGPDGNATESDATE